MNRQDGRMQAEENIKEAIEAHAAYPDVVVGVDLSGNPSFGNVVDEMLPLFEEARTSGLKIALHCAEVIIVTCEVYMSLNIFLHSILIFAFFLIGSQ